MWHKRTHTLANLTKFCSTKIKFELNDVENGIFHGYEKIVGWDVLLLYPNFSEEFITHTDASKTHPRG